jgi:hypothetical protein
MITLVNFVHLRRFDMLQLLTKFAASCDPQPCNNGDPPIVPWRHYYCSVCYAIILNKQPAIDLNFVPAAKNVATPF